MKAPNMNSDVKENFKKYSNIPREMEDTMFMKQKQDAIKKHLGKRRNMKTLPTRNSLYYGDRLP